MVSQAGGLQSRMPASILGGVDIFTPLGQHSESSNVLYQLVILHCKPCDHISASADRIEPVQHAERTSSDDVALALEVLFDRRPPVPSSCPLVPTLNQSS